MDPPLAGDDKPHRTPSLEIRLFYVRIAPIAPDLVPPHLSLSHLPKSPSTTLEINNARIPNPDPCSLSLRRDRLDRDAGEVTYVSTDSVRLTGAVDISISDDRGNLILSGSLDRGDADGVSQHQGPSSSCKDSKTGWSMECCTADSVVTSAFVQHKAGILCPSFEVYIAGCFAGSPLILTQTVHLAPRKKVARSGAVDSVLEDGDVSGREQRGEEGLQRRKAPSSSSMDGGDGSIDMAQIQKAGLSVIVACTTLMLELLRRREIIWPTEPSMYRDIRRNANMQRIIGGGRDSCTDFIRMDQPAFFKLVDLMRQRSLLRDTIHVSVEEQLAMFLHILGHSSSNRAAKTGFNRSGETISRYFNLVLGAMSSLRDEFVRQPGPEMHPEISNNPAYYPWFKDCVGLVGGAHIEATVVPADVIGHLRGRKDRPARNVVAAVAPDKSFCYVLPGCEGPANDFTILRDELQVPEGKYYLADHGFTIMPGFIAPYRSEHYHLKEQPGFSPESSKELFNLRHASLCSRVKSAFGILKNRFKILSSHPSFPLPTLVDIVLACCVVHNFILGADPNDRFLNGEIEVVEDEEEQDFDAWAPPEQTEETMQWMGLRDQIAEDMWLDFNRYN